MGTVYPAGRVASENLRSCLAALPDLDVARTSGEPDKMSTDRGTEIPGQRDKDHARGLQEELGEKALAHEEHVLAAHGIY